jgi:hypothetical protein
LPFSRGEYGIFVCSFRRPVIDLSDVTRLLIDALLRLQRTATNAELCLLKLADVVPDGSLQSPRMHHELETVAFATGVPLSTLMPLACVELRRHSSVASQMQLEAARRASDNDMLTRLGVESDDRSQYADDAAFMHHLRSLVDEYGGVEDVAAKPKIANSLFAMAQMLATGSDRPEAPPSLGSAVMARRAMVATGGGLRRRDSPMVLQRKSEKSVRNSVRAPTDAGAAAAAAAGAAATSSDGMSPPRLSSSARTGASRRHKALPVSASAQKRSDHNRRHSTLGENVPRRSRSAVHSTAARDESLGDLRLPLPPSPTATRPHSALALPSISPSEMLSDGWMTAREEQNAPPPPPAAASPTQSKRSARGAPAAGSPLKTSMSIDRMSVVPAAESSSSAAAPPVLVLATRLANDDAARASVVVAQRVVRHWLARRRLRRTREMLRRRANVVIEMKTTEESFVSQLEEIRDVFLTPIKAKALLSDADLKVLSLNVPLLLNLHLGLRDELRVRVAQWSRVAEVGGIFLKLVPFLKLHTEYVKTYDVAIQKLTELRANAPFTAFMRTCTSAARAGLSGEQYMQTLLIAPIQRIPRYQMLLNECLKATPLQHSDHEQLHRAVEGVRAVANHINDSKKEDDTRRRVAALQRKIQGSIERMSWLSVEGRLLRHQYVARSFSKPTTCGACHRMIWGLRNKGFQCKQCGVALHRNHKCANGDFSLCDGARSEKDERSIASVPQLFSPGRRLVKEGEAQFQLPTFPLVAADDDGESSARLDGSAPQTAAGYAWHPDAPTEHCIVLLFNDMLVVARRQQSASVSARADGDGDAAPEPAVAPEGQMYEFFTRVLYDHNSLARSVSQLYRDDSAAAGRPCILISTVSGNVMRLFFDDEDTCHQWLAAMSAEYSRFAPG